METKSIIDIHCHAAGIGSGGSGCFISGDLRKSWRYKPFLAAFGVTEKELREHGDGLVLKRISESLAESRYVAKAVVLAMDGVVGEDGELDRAKTEIYIPNEFVSAEVRCYNNLIFGASINPYRRDALERLQKAADDGAALVKWLPSIQNVDPADKRLIPFYKRLKELGLPLLTHTGKENSFTRSNDKLGDPEQLRVPLSHGVVVIAAHSACSGRNHGERNLDRLIRLCSEYPNLYADISALTQINRPGCMARAMKQKELHGRLLYGTDMPLINTCLVSSFAHPFSISLREMIAISSIANPWDRDVALKKAMGVTEEVLMKAEDVLRREDY